jgi:hypothetical protein
MLAKFPPGGTVYKSKHRCKWREFAFVLHQMQQVIDPVVSLKKIIIGWNKISMALSENSRRRKPQISNYKFS